MNSTTVSKKSLLMIWLALLLLLFLTWGLAQLDLRAFNVTAALTIAAAKMLLVILIFMHVRYKPPLTWIFVAAGFVWLIIMIDLTLSDYLTRGGVPGVPGQSWVHGTWPSPAKDQPDPGLSSGRDRKQEPNPLR